MRTFNEWVALFEKKSGENHINPKGYKTIYDAEKGYCQILITDGDINVHECCGDGKFWYDFVLNIAIKRKLNRIILLCTRSILPYLRLMCANITDMQKDKDSYRIRGITKNRVFNCFPVWRNAKTNIITYAIIVEVNK